MKHRHLEETLLVSGSIGGMNSGDMHLRDDRGRGGEQKGQVAVVSSSEKGQTLCQE